MSRALIAGVAALGLLTGQSAAQQGPGQPGLHFIEQWDADGDGAVSAAEARERRAEIFYMFDADEDGVLSGAEYDAFDRTRAADMANQPNAHALGPVVQGMERSFTDADGDGRVTEEEFLAANEAWLARLDADGDGVVTTADFAARMSGGATAWPGAGQARGQGAGGGN